MIVVSDTTPIHYLILIGKEFILPELFTEIIIPDVVVSEMSHPKAPQRVQGWIANLPAWAATCAGSEKLMQTISGLGKGETAAIAIAIERKVDAVLMDDRRAIREASKNGVTTLTTFALLELASLNQLIDFEEAIDDLAKTNFHFPPDQIVKEYLRRVR